MSKEIEDLKKQIKEMKEYILYKNEHPMSRFFIKEVIDNVITMGVFYKKDTIVGLFEIDLNNLVGFDGRIEKYSIEDDILRIYFEKRKNNLILIDSKDIVAKPIGKKIEFKLTDAGFSIISLNDYIEGEIMV